MLGLSTSEKASCHGQVCTYNSHLFLISGLSGHDSAYNEIFALDTY